ncbi:MAG: undecaprenyl-diphosphatase UppP [Chloroflexi bacterium]|nr:undecaprenyl-diphosphatase UppP [Chloroflexota bacterium]
MSDHLLQAVVLAIVQGITEFLPISSSGHLVLVTHVFGWKDLGLPFDAAVHLGSLVAVLLYFRREWLQVAREAVRPFRKQAAPVSDPPPRPLLLLLLVATIPAAVAGLLAAGAVEAHFRGPVIVGWLLLFTGTVLVLGERLAKRRREMPDVTARDALLVGVAQVATLLPGVSRSGTTIAAGMSRGLSRETAARFSFLMAGPVLLGAGVLEAWKVTVEGDWGSQWPVLGLGALVSAVVSLVSIRALLAYIRRSSLLAFAAYSFTLGALVLVLNLAL